MLSCLFSNFLIDNETQNGNTNVDSGYSININEIYNTDQELDFGDLDLEALCGLHEPEDDLDVLLLTDGYKCDNCLLGSCSDFDTACRCRPFGNIFETTTVQIQTQQTGMPLPEFRNLSIQTTNREESMDTQAYNKNEANNCNQYDEIKSNNGERSNEGTITTTDKEKTDISEHDTEHLSRTHGHVSTHQQPPRSVEMPLHRKQEHTEDPTESRDETGINADSNKEYNKTGAEWCTQCTDGPAAARMANTRHDTTLIRVIQGSPQSQDNKFITSFAMDVVRESKSHKTAYYRYPYWQKVKFYSRLRNYVHHKTMGSFPFKQFQEVDIRTKIIMKNIEYRTTDGKLFCKKTQNRNPSHFNSYPTPKHIVVDNKANSTTDYYDSEFTVYISTEVNMDQAVSQTKRLKTDELFNTFKELINNQGEQSDIAVLGKLMNSYAMFKSDKTKPGDLRQTITNIQKRKTDQTEENSDKNIYLEVENSPEPPQKKDFHRKAQHDEGQHTTTTTKNQTTSFNTQPKLQRTQDYPNHTPKYQPPHLRHQLREKQTSSNLKYRHPNHYQNQNRNTPYPQHQWKDSNHSHPRTTPSTSTYTSQGYTQHQQNQYQTQQHHPYQWQKYHRQGGAGNNYNIGGPRTTSYAQPIRDYNQTYNPKRHFRGTQNDPRLTRKRQPGGPNPKKGLLEDDGSNSGKNDTKETTTTKRKQRTKLAPFKTIKRIKPTKTQVQV